MSHDQSKKSTVSTTSGPAARGAPVGNADAKTPNAKKGRKDAKGAAPATPGLQDTPAATPTSSKDTSNPGTVPPPPLPMGQGTASSKGPGTGPVSLGSLAGPPPPLSFLTPDPQSAKSSSETRSDATPQAPPPLPGAKGRSDSTPTSVGLPPPADKSASDRAASRKSNAPSQASAGAPAAPPPDLSAMGILAKGTPPPTPRSIASSSAGGPTLAFAAPAVPAEPPSGDRSSKIDIDQEAHFDAEDLSDADRANAEVRKRVARRRPAGPVRGRVAANDDAPSIGGLIYALEQKPSNLVYRHAAIASVVWAVLGLIFAYLSLSSEAALSSWGAILAQPITFLTGAAIVIPIAVIWLLALLSWRAEELRLRSSTMTEVAIRLAEPDRMAEDSIASLGQAVRRQVSFMNEAVGRAIGRAGELEALVHNEVAALERSYEENERRIRGLINELANERHALTSTSVSFNETLRTLGREVPVLIEKLSNQQTNLSHIIKGAGDNLNQLETSLAKSVTSLESELGGRTTELKGVLENYTGALGQALTQRTDQLGTMLGTHGQRLQAMMDDRSKRLGESLGTRTEDMQKMLETYTGALAQALSQRTAQMQSSFAEHMNALDKAIANRTTNLQTVFEEYSHALDSTLAARAGKLDKQLIERTRALDSAFEGRLQLFDQAIQKSTRAIDLAVDNRAKALTSALENHAQTFSETISRQSLELDESLNQGITSVRRTSENITRQSLKAIESLAGQSDMLKSVSENLVSQISSLTNRFEAQGHTILKAANALESVNYKIDSTLQSRHAELSATLDRMVGKADEFTRNVQDYSSAIEGSLSEAETRALAAAEQLKLGTQTHREHALTEIERLKAETDAESARALQALKDRLSHISAEVSSQLGSLTHHFSETSEDVRKRAERVSDEVSTQLGSLTHRFTETSEDVRKRAERVADELAREQARIKQEAERVSDEVSTHLGSLTHRFTETSEDVRKRAERVADDLAREQARIKQEAERLPHTTRESAEAMRQALQDQLRAIDQLSSLANREAQRRDVVLPMAQGGALKPADAAPAAAPASASRQLSGEGGTSSSRRLSSLSESLANELGARVGKVSGSAKASGPQAHPERHSDAQDTETSASSWSLGDLLKRASNEDASAPQQSAGTSSAPEASEPFKLDIDVLARALDSATAAVLWQRLRAGQRGIMVRSIYSAEGRHVFDEVARRYPSDPNLQITINRYIADFERILRDTESRDSSGRLAQSHMTSTMGRVYLLLAHASGRIS